jgi:hypothetical protein
MRGRYDRRTKMCERQALMSGDDGLIFGWAALNYTVNCRSFILCRHLAISRCRNNWRLASFVARVSVKEGNEEKKNH